MKWIKNLTLAAIAAAALMAFLGAGTASATQLCTDSGGICTEYSGNITGTATNATLATNLANVECSDSATTINAATSGLTPRPQPLERGFGLARADCERQGTATSPPSTVRRRA